MSLSFKGQDDTEMNIGDFVKTREDIVNFSYFNNPLLQ